MEACTDSIEMQDILTSMLENAPDMVMDDKISETISDNGLNTSNNSYAEKKDPRDAHNEKNKLQVEPDDLTLKSNSLSATLIQEKRNSKKASGKKGVQIKSNKSVSSSSSGEEVLQTRLSVSNKNVVLEEEEYSMNSNSVSLAEKLDNKCAECDSKNGTPFSVNNKIVLYEEYANNNIPISPAEKSDNECITEYNPKINATTFSISKRNISHENKLNNDSNSISSEKKLYKSNNDSKNSNTSPIIIQAIACQKTSSNKDNLNSKIKQPKVSNRAKKSKVALASEDSPSVDASNSITDVRNSTPNANDHFNYRRKDSRRNPDRNEVLEELMEKISAISGSDSINIKYANSKKAVSDEFIVEDFLNGSLDLSLYSDRELSNSTKKSAASNMQHEKNKSTATETNMNVYENNAFTREISSSFIQKNNSNNTKNSFNVSSLNTPNKTLKRRQPCKKSGKSTKRARTTPKNKKNMNIISDSPMEVNLNLNSELENISGNTRQAKKLNQLLNADGNTSISNKFNRQSKAVNNRNKVRSSTPKEKNMKYDKIINSLLNSPIQHSGRKRRHSSLIASRKIKEIEELENSKSVEEVYLDSEDETLITPILSKFESRKAGKQKYQTENILNRDDLNYKTTTAEEDDESLQFYSSSDYKTANTRLTRNKNVLKTTFDGSSTHDKNSVPDLDLYNDNFMQGDEELYNKLHMNKRDHSSKYSLEGMQSAIFSISKKSTVNKGEPRRNEEPSIDTYKGPMTRNKRKTWDTLEKELFGEPEKETFLSHEVDKPAILQLSKSVKNQNQQKDNAFTLSNAMMKTVGRDTDGNKCNMQYQLSTESKYVRSKPTSYEYSNDFSNSQSKAIVPSYSKSTNIIEKSIAAMEKCTSQFYIPKEGSSKDEVQATQFEDVSDYSNTSHEAMFQSNITFMRKENKHYYKNEIVGYLKKSIRIDQSTNSNNTERENSDNAEHLNESSFVVKSFSFRNLTEEKIHESDQEVVPSSGEKYNNPWNKLMRELSLDNKKTCLKEISNDEEDVNVISKHQIHLERNELNMQQESKPKIMNVEDDSNKEDENSCSDYEQESIKVRESRETELIVDHALSSDNFANSSLNADAKSRGKHQKKTSKPEDESVAKILEKPKMKSEIYKRRAPKVQTRKSSPKFKLQISKNGSLKLKKHCSRSSSVTSSSEEYTHRRQNNESAAMENEAKDKYKRYLLKLFDKEDTILKSMTDDHDKIKSTNVKSKKPEKFVDKSRNQRMGKLKLIAEKDDDVFSLSSSDSEPCSKDRKGSGDLCDLFD